jgi:hypothetical protein
MTETLTPREGTLVQRVLGQFATAQFWKDLAFKLLREGVQRAISGVVEAIVGVFKNAIPPEHRKTSPSSVFESSRPAYSSYGSSYNRGGSMVPMSTQPTRGDTMSFPDLPANF